MPNQFYKGRTNNHLSWVMVDATDFATPESALSAAMKIKIWGKLRGGTGTNFVSSGTGSLTNDITHVGPSVLGQYTIALAKADLSDASAAWYDQYIINLSATGAAYQTLIVDGGINDSALSKMQSTLSDIQSYLAVMSGVQSDLYSAMLAPGASFTSDIASAVWAHAVGTRVDSRVLVAQSYLSDIRSHLSDVQSDFQSRVPKLVASNSQLSDLASDLKSYLAVMSGIQSDIYSLLSSRVTKLVASNSQVSDLASDLKSYLAVMSGVQSDIYSAMLAPGASFTSDIASAVWAHAVGTRVDSRVLVNQSYLSDIRSHLSDIQSDFQSRVPKAVATNSQLSDLHSDLRSFLVVMSDVLSDLQSDFQSRVPKLVATSSQLSDLSSDVKSAVEAITVSISASDVSDIASAVVAGLTGLTASDISNIASAVWADVIGARVDSRILVNQSYLSDIRSHLSDIQSDFQSRVPKLVATNSQLSDLTSDLASDLKSYLAVMSGVQSDVYSLLSSRVPKEVASKSLVSDVRSDLRSQISGLAASVSASDISDIASAVWANAIGARVDSRIVVNQSYLSDIRSHLSDIQSDFQSRVPKLVATNSQVSDLHSDLKSYLAVMSGVQSDIYSLLSDVSSDLDAGLTVNLAASDLSDLRSAIAANGVLLTGAEPTSIPAHTAPLASKIDWVYTLAANRIDQTSVLQTVANSALNTVIASAVVSDDGTTFRRDAFSS